MIHRVALSATLGNQARVALPWNADKVVISNPNNANLYVKMGSTEYPVAVSADIRGQRQMWMAHAVIGRNFGLQLGDPGDVLTDITTVEFMTRDEETPSYGSLPLQTLSVTIPGTVTVSGGVSIPSGVNVNNQPGGPVTNVPNVGVPGGVAVTNTPGGPVTNTPNVAVPSGVAVTNTPGGPVTNTPNVAVPSGVAVTNTPGGPVTNTPNVGIPSGVVTNTGSVTTTQPGSQAYATVNNASWNSVSITVPSLAPGGNATIGAFVNLDAGGWQIVFTNMSGPDPRLDWLSFTGVSNNHERYFRIPVAAGTVIITLPITQQGIVLQLVNDAAVGSFFGIWYLRRVWQTVNEVGVQTIQDLPLTSYDINLNTIVGNVRGPQLVNPALTADDRWLVGYQLSCLNAGILVVAAFLELWVGSAATPITFLGKFLLEYFFGGGGGAPNWQSVNTPYMQPNAGQPGGVLMTAGNEYIWIVSNVAAMPVRGAAFARRRL